MDFSFQLYCLPPLTSRAFHLSVPLAILEYTSLNYLALTYLAVNLAVSSLVGQMSLRKMFFPSLFWPIGSFSKSMSTVPARA